MQPQVFLTSDTHYGHKNICRGTSAWVNSSEQATRNFGTIEEMNSSIVNGINNKVKENDILYHLGDWSFGGLNNVWEFRKQIKCKNIHLILGNHDHHIKNDKLLPNLLTEEERNLYNSDKLYAKRLFTSTQYVKTIKAGDKSIFMSHYPHLAWANSNKENHIHLHGHEHSNINYINKGLNRLDIGIDSYYKYFGKYEPFSLTQVLEILKDCKPIHLEHHSV